jgi:hypothetical protein
MILQAFLLLILPAFLLYDLFAKRHRVRREWLVSVLLVGLYLLLALHVARLDAFTYYLAAVLPLLFVFASIRSYRRIGADTSGAADAGVKNQGEARRDISKDFVVGGVVALVLLGINVWVYAGRIPPTEPVQLEYPLRDGRYFVGGGGGNRLTNNHMQVASQAYALDILQLNAFGRPYSGFDRSDLQAYAVFGDRVNSPCDGVVAVTLDGLPDQVPPSRDTVNLAGNHVVVSCHGVDVLLAHMQEGSVSVAAGDTVGISTVLGRVGNSGNTSQPHLHIHAERGGEPEVILDGEGTPMELGGRFLVRNAMFGK